MVLCCVLVGKVLGLIAVVWGQGGDKIGAKARILGTKVVCWLHVKQILCQTMLISQRF